MPGLNLQPIFLDFYVSLISSSKHIGKEGALPGQEKQKPVNGQV